MREDAFMKTVAAVLLDITPETECRTCGRPLDVWTLIPNECSPEEWEQCHRIQPK
jgi:hypothetical protein